MTFTDPIAGVFLFLGVMLINRVLGEKALKRLTAEEKAKLLDSFSGYRIYSVVVLVVLVLGFFVAAKVAPDLRQTLTWGLFGLVILSFVVMTLLSYMKLKSLAVAEHYINNFVVRSCLQMIALVFLVFTFVTHYFPSR